MTLPQKYNFTESEKKWQKSWYEQGVYSWNPEETNNQYVIDTPPPTVSGHLHMGHIFSYTQADFIARYKRMIGKNVFYPMGFDDNGLPTERLVEKLKKVQASQMDRTAFKALCKEVVKESEEKYRSLFRSTALSVDWSQEYQTISDNSQKISQMSFLDLVQKGQVYRASQPILWDPVDRTALAQADIEDKERTSFMNDILFELENGEKITIATTRPEMLPACLCVFFHPEDARYKHLAGMFAFSPLFKVRVPLIADSTVDMEKGTGLVMCCSFGDTTDIEWWKKHKLPMRLIIDQNGRIREFDISSISTDPDNAASYYNQIQGLKVAEARNKVIELLKQENLLIKQEERLQVVKCAERSGAPLEIITAPQWFVKTVEHKEAMLKRSTEVNWHPHYMKIRLDNWIESLNWDWCISRQRFFGVPFPVWYSKRAGEEGKPIYADPAQLPVDPMVDLPIGYSREEVVADMDVMDTWATSAVSPQLNSHGISKDFSIDAKRHSRLFPADLRPQAHEIIRTWAFYTILKSHLHEQSLPWKNIMISGWCLAENKEKMSKSKGNIVDPMQLLQTYGSDIVRFWASTSKLGADTAYSEEVLKNGKRLINKLWNATKFASLHFSILPKLNSVATSIKDGTIYHATDKWILSKLQSVVDIATSEFEKYEYSNARSAVETFFWQDFCDNYLEIAKARSYDPEGKDPKGQISAVATLYFCLEAILKLFAPFVPHITEELYQGLFATEGSIHKKGIWPKLADYYKDNNDISEGDKLVKILDEIRKAKAEKNLSIKYPIDTIEVQTQSCLINNLELIQDLLNVTNAAKIDFVENFSKSEQIVESEGLRVGIKYSEQLDQVTGTQG